jgi:hypothetical protein
LGEFEASHGGRVALPAPQEKPLADPDAQGKAAEKFGFR